MHIWISWNVKTYNQMSMGLSQRAAFNIFPAIYMYIYIQQRIINVLRNFCVQYCFFWKFYILHTYAHVYIFIRAYTYTYILNHREFPASANERAFMHTMNYIDSKSTALDKSWHNSHFLVVFCIPFSICILCSYTHTHIWPNIYWYLLIAEHTRWTIYVCAWRIW